MHNLLSWYLGRVDDFATASHPFIPYLAQNNGVLLISPVLRKIYLVCKGETLEVFAPLYAYLSNYSSHFYFSNL